MASPRTSRLSFVALCFGIALFACSGENTGGGGDEDTDGNDTGAGDVNEDTEPDVGEDPTDDPGQDVDTGSDTGDDVGEDADATDDGDAEDAEEDVMLTPVGEICGDNSECQTNLCMRLDPSIDDGFCSTFCFEDVDCPDDAWECIFLTNSGGDISQVCVPNALCFDDDDDGYGVGPGCDGPDCNDESAAVNPGAEEVCDGIDNDCDSNIDDFPTDVNQDCATGFEGRCAIGRTRCQAGFLMCDPDAAPEAEECDGIDNDCDGDIDEDAMGNPLEFECYSGPADTAGVGLCTVGVRACVDGSVLACEGQVLPVLELCDGLDNDCDGMTDEGMPGAGAACDTGELGVCARGITQCDAMGEIECVQREMPTTERCDGFDNDCDGETDEDDTGMPLTQACYDGPGGTLGVGLCAEGLQTCTDGEFSVCTGDVTPLLELCNNADDDCDGMADEGDPASGFTCDTGLLGNCAFGRTTCGGGTAACVPDFDPATEICNGLDDDCDGVVDESATVPGDPMTRACYTGPMGTEGTGECIGGLETCVVGTWSDCNDEVVPAGEFCNGRDDDCDGGTDEDESGDPLSQACYSADPMTQDVGLCTGGTRTCTGGSFGVCAGEVLPLPIEFCNGEDDDCDGMADEGDPETGNACNTGLSGICSQGTTSCNAGTLDCVPDFSAGTEVCDGIDNDCDGDVDLDDMGNALTDSCYGGPPMTQGVGLCASGTRTCSGGVFQNCAGEVLPQSEICDGFDNDCDGMTDEGDPGGGFRCDTGDLGVCQPGITACQGGGVVCVAEQTSSSEVCDGLDNDCDGEVDTDGSGTPIGSTCYDGPAMTAGVGLCTQGTNTCVDGELTGCVGQVVPSFELCDTEDNDCDGTADEGNPGGGVICATGLPGICAQGTTTCSGGSVDCVADFTAGTEVCDGLDNDCDGEIDENVAGTGPLERSCYSGLPGTQNEGVCTEGTQTCVGGSFGTCSGQVTPGLEICDTFDNDCDGSADENNPGGGVTCSTGDDGICAQGTTSCSGGTLDCVADFSSSAEICDGLDNDCDGSTDENVAGTGPLERSCYSGLPGTEDEGLCTEGTQTCTAGVFGTCTGQVTPTLELCDTEDNDCDGVADENDPEGGFACATGQPGVCADGVTQCSAGAVVCAPQTAPGAEICDGLDNNCDGLTDNADAMGTAITRSCYEGPPGTETEGLCSAGVQTCSMGGFGTCVGMTLPTFEVCDGEDNDCDGLVDEGDPGGNASCSTGQDGICDAGVTTCSGGAIVCNRTFDPVAETCNGFDDNCDGLVDNADAMGTPLTQSCYTGPGGTLGTGTCAAGTETCTGGAFGSCLGQTVPVTDVCDTFDNDCDGMTDENVEEVFWADLDNDNFTDGTVIEGCFDPDIHLFPEPDTGNTCTLNGDCTSGLCLVTGECALPIDPADIDCYDLNADANPLQLGFFQGDRGDGSFDYNCDGTDEQRLSGFNACSAMPPNCFQVSPGWLSPADGGSSIIPSCGEPGRFVEDCVGNGNNCDPYIPDCDSVACGTNETCTLGVCYCQPGFRDDGTGTCVADATCPNPCTNPGEECRDDGGGGVTCECGDGFVLFDGTCQPLDLIQPQLCR